MPRKSKGSKRSGVRSNKRSHKKSPSPERSSSPSSSSSPPQEEENNNAEIDSLMREHDTHMVKLRQAYEVEIRELRSKWEKRMLKLEQEMDQKDDNLKKQMIEEAAKEADAFANKIKESYEQELSRQKEQHARKVAELKKQVVDAAFTAAKDYELEKDAIHKAKQQSLIDTQKEMDELRARYYESSQKLKSKLEHSHDRLQHAHSVIEGLKKEGAEREERIKALVRESNQVKLSMRELEQEKQRLETSAREFAIDARDYRQGLDELNDHHKNLHAKHKSLEQHTREAEQDLVKHRKAAELASQDLVQEKSKYIDTREKFEEAMNRVNSLTVALQKCSSDHVDVEKVLRDMREQYQALKKRSAKVIEDMKRMAEQNRTYKEEMEAEKRRAMDVEKQLQASRERLEHQIQQNATKEKQAFSLLEECQQKNHACMTVGSSQSTHIKKLEREIKRLLEQLQLERENTTSKNRAVDMLKVQDEAMVELKTSLDRIRHENLVLKGFVKEYEEHKERDLDLLARQRELERKHNDMRKERDEARTARSKEYQDLTYENASLKELIKNMERRFKATYQQHKTSRLAMSKVKNMILENEDKLSQAVTDIKRVEEERDEWQKKAESCMYPGERQRMLDQMDEMIKQREIMKQKMEGLVSKHGELFNKYEALTAEKKNLEVVKERSRMEIDSMREIIEQTSKISAQLIKAKKLLSKKDKQLSMLSGQLTSLVDKIKSLEQAESELQQKLKVSVDPEELDRTQERLVKCRGVMKSTAEQLRIVRAASEKLQEQNQVQSDRIRALVGTLQHNENAKQRIQEEIEARNKLEDALKACVSTREESDLQLRARIQAMDAQYKTSVMENERLMKESALRVEELEKQLTRTKTEIQGKADEKMQLRLKTLEQQYKISLIENDRLLADSAKKMARLQDQLAQANQVSQAKSDQQLQAKLKVLEQQYKASLMENERIMTESARRIVELQNRLANEEQALSVMKAKRNEVPEPLQAQMNKMEARTNSAIEVMKQELTALERTRQEQNMKHQAFEKHMQKLAQNVHAAKMDQSAQQQSFAQKMESLTQSVSNAAQIHSQQHQALASRIAEESKKKDLESVEAIEEERRKLQEQQVAIQRQQQELLQRQQAFQKEQEQSDKVQQQEQARRHLEAQKTLHQQQLALQKRDEALKHNLAQQKAMAQQQQITSQDQTMLAGQSKELAALQGSEKAAEIDKVRQEHLAALHQKEKEIMDVRHKTYEHMLEALSQVNQGGGGANPQDVQDALTMIRKRGWEREQQHLKDLLRLRALNQRLATEYNQARATQWSMMNGARQDVQQSLLHTLNAPQVSMGQVRGHLQNLAALGQAQHGFIHTEMDQAQRAYQAQNAYTRQLESTLPTMNYVVNTMNTNLNQFPNMQPLAQKLQKDQHVVLGSLRKEHQEIIDKKRTVSALQSSLDAANTSVQAMTQSLRNLLNQPTEENLQAAKEAAQETPETIKARQRRMNQMMDRAGVRTVFHFMPPQPGKKVAGSDTMAVSEDTSSLMMNGGDENAVEKFFGSDVSIFKEPSYSLEPTMARADRQLAQKSDLVVVTYSYAESADKKDPTRYFMFAQAVEHLFPRIQRIAQGGLIDAQMVKVKTDEGRFDQLGKRALQEGCSYLSCESKRIRLNSYGSATKLINSLLTDFPADDEGQSHLVLTFSLGGKGPRIHICDVLYSQIPPADLKLVDSSWVTYLSDIIQMPDTKIDLFFVFQPYEDPKTVNSNQRMGQISTRLNEFFGELRSQPTGNA